MFNNKVAIFSCNGKELRFPIPNFFLMSNPDMEQRYWWAEKKLEAIKTLIPDFKVYIEEE